MVAYDLIGNNGRLGNQLFQISSTIGIALKNNTKFCFNKAPIFDYLPNLKNYIIGNIDFNPKYIYKETDFTYEDVSLPANEDIILNGYFQSIHYFNIYKEIVDYYLTFENPLFSENFNKFNGINTCSVHVRRGDYVLISKTNPLNPHPLVSKEYYLKAMETIKADKYLFFSDDIAWCKENFKDDKYVFIEKQNDSLANDIFELQLMSTCKNNIIANSSFSWWGAYLNLNENKIVIAPKQWFSENYIKIISKHSLSEVLNSLIPEKWIII